MSGGTSSPVILRLLEQNRAWARGRLEEDPRFFAKLAERQQPSVLLIGCSDSRKCLNTMFGTRPGELFIHRNIANQVFLDDPNVQAVLEFAILNLRVPHVIVAGHTRCGGVGAALERHTEGMVGRWLGPLRDLAARHDRELLALPRLEERADRLSELNVVAQVDNVLRSHSIGEARRRGSAPEVHGWLFQLETGLIRGLELPPRP